MEFSELKPGQKFEFDFDNRNSPGNWIYIKDDDGTLPKLKYRCAMRESLSKLTILIE